MTIANLNFSHGSVYYYVFNDMIFHNKSRTIDTSFAAFQIPGKITLELERLGLSRDCESVDGVPSLRTGGDLSGYEETATEQWLLGFQINGSK